MPELLSTATSGVARRLLVVLVVLLALVGLASAAPAGAYTNGNIPGSALAPIYNPTHTPRQVLAKANGAAAAWNTLNLGLWEMHKPMLQANGDGAPYRACHGPGYTQDYAYYHSPPGYAAVPCTSRHGLGWALDLYSPSWSRPLLDRYGPALLWSWGWVDYEPWHVEFHGIYGHPDPGVSPAHAYLKLGSGGRYQDLQVRIVQQRLLNLGYYPHRPGAPSSFNNNLRLAVYTYQVSRNFKQPSGTVTRNTWLALRQPQAGAKTRAATANAIGKLAGLKHGSRGPGVSQLSRDLAFVRYHAKPGEHFYHGPVLSFFTNGLAGALKAWQKDNKLPATGVYDGASAKLMGTSLRYWHKRFPTIATPSADHPAPRPVVQPANPGSRLFSDISGNNASVDLKVYAASNHHVLALKLTEGSDFTSDTALQRWRYMRQLHLTRLAYDFARPSQNSCTAEADNFGRYAKKLGWYPGDIAVLDWEDPGAAGRNLTSWVTCYTKRLAVSWKIRVGLIYSYGDYISNTLDARVFYGWAGPIGYWHAQYSSAVSSSTAPSWARSRLAAIQFTDGQYGASPHSLPGVGVGDVNRLTVTFTDLAKYGQR